MGQIEITIQEAKEFFSEELKNIKLDKTKVFFEYSVMIKGYSFNDIVSGKSLQDEKKDPFEGYFVSLKIKSKKTKTIDFKEVPELFKQKYNKRQAELEEESKKDTRTVEELIAELSKDPSFMMFNIRKQ